MEHMGIMINQQGFRSLLVTTPSTDALQAHTRTRTHSTFIKNSKLLRLHLLDTEPAGTNAGRDDSYWGLYFLMEDNHLVVHSGIKRKIKDITATEKVIIGW